MSYMRLEVSFERAEETDTGEIYILGEGRRLAKRGAAHARSKRGWPLDSGRLRR